MTARTKGLPTLAITATLTAIILLATNGAYASGHGGSGAGSGGQGYSPKGPVIVNTIHPIVDHPLHGTGSSHNPIVIRPVHGSGSSHDPIVESERWCYDPSIPCPPPSYPY